MKLENGTLSLESFEYRTLGRVRFIGIDAWRTGENWDVLWNRREEFMPLLDTLMPRYAATITEMCSMMHHNGREVDTENHYLAGRFFQADTPVPDGYDFYDVPTERAAYAVYNTKEYDWSVGKAYYFTRDKILSDGNGIPYPARYWHAEVYTNGRPKVGSYRFGYLFSVIE